MGIATGVQKKFSFKGVALSALSAGVNAGLGELTKAGGAAGKVGAFLNKGTIGSDLIRGAAASAITQGIGTATGLQSSFSWAGVAAAGVGAGVGGALGGQLRGNPQGFGNTLATATAGGIANAATRSAINGNSFGKNLQAAIPDIIGQAVGGAIGNALRGDGRPEKIAEAVNEASDPALQQPSAQVTGNVVAADSTTEGEYAEFLQKFDATFSERGLSLSLQGRGAEIAATDPEAYRAAVDAVNSGKLRPFSPIDPELDIAIDPTRSVTIFATDQLNAAVVARISEKGFGTTIAELNEIIDGYADTQVVEGDWSLSGNVSIADLVADVDKHGTISITHTYEEANPLFNQWVGYMADSEIGSAIFAGLAVGDSQAVDVLRNKYPTSTAVGEYGSLLLGVGGAAKGMIRNSAGDLVSAAARNSDDVVDLFGDLARQGTKNPDADTVVLGRFVQPRNGRSYNRYAASNGHTYFELDNWNELYTKHGDQMWKANESFLQQQVSAGKKIVLTHSPDRARIGSYFAREVSWLRRAGYSFTKSDGTWKAVYEGIK